MDQGAAYNPICTTQSTVGGPLNRGNLIVVSENKETIGTAIASPTKEFFVKMLTRDIELQDAILDLLDNCVDGILRTDGIDLSLERPYNGFHSKIIFSADHFQISDNCGGIPLDTAKKYAFAMGRPSGATQQRTPATVGMYGIGMKRAIFKIGTDALVESRHDTGFSVEFTPKWMSSDSWDDLPLHELPSEKLPSHGTSITVFTINEEVKSAFSDKAWIDEFRKLVARHYSIIISKGFAVSVGDGESDPIVIDAEPFRLLRTAPTDSGQIAPFVYSGTLDGVDVEIYAGLYRELLSSEEADREEETRGTADDAGWTVACNDRVVVWKDKSRLTGWGEASVPNYHGQFIAITGIVLMRSDDPKRLPLTTTKRGIDASSNVYSEAKDLMREATKSLTSFTNRWKKFPEKLDTIYRQSEYVDLAKLRSLPASIDMAKVRKLPTMTKYEPRYPEPSEAKTHLVVKFEAPKGDVAFLGKNYFGDDGFKASDVGKEAFSQALKAARATDK